jgi:cytochrome oxidase assembly protein ShyY1
MVDITGHVYVAPGSPFLLEEQQLEGDWPKRIQAVEMDKLAPLIVALQGGNVFPYPIRIDADARGALVTDWQIVNMSPVKHQAYAVQWFAMAAVLLMYYLMRSSNLWQLLTGSLRTGD